MYQDRKEEGRSKRNLLSIEGDFNRPQLKANL